MKIKKHLLTGAILLLMTIAICFFSAREFNSMHKKDEIYPSNGLSEKKLLSDYSPGLRNTPGDTEIYIFQGEKEGGNLLILGGSHPNEPAGFITAVLLVENIQVSQGKIVLIPQANNSGFTHNDTQEGNPQRFPIATPDGKRWFRYGSRLTNPTHQWPDPTLYVNSAGQKLSGAESRNLNRSYPGKERGLLTEKIAHGIMNLIRKEQIDLALDLHEAAPEYPVINAIVFHENSAELAALALLDLQLEDFEFQLEASPTSLHGLSHREWGDYAHIQAILLETANASHGRLKGKPSVSLIVEGKDKNYAKAAKLGRLFVPFDEEGIPLKQRASRHLAAIKSIVSSLKELSPDRSIEIVNLPSAAQLKKEGIGAYLKPPK